MKAKVREKVAKLVHHDPMRDAVFRTYNCVVDAEFYAYAGGGDRALKDDLIRAHSALLSAKNRLKSAA